MNDTKVYKFLSLQEASDMVALAPTAIQAAINSGALRLITEHDTGKTWISEHELMKWYKQQ